jgi:hypothetical protein
MNVNAPTVDRHPATKTKNKLDALALVTDDHDGSYTAPNVLVRLILLASSETASLEIENVVVHTIRD